MEASRKLFFGCKPIFTGNPRSEEAYNAYTSYYIDHSYYDLPVDTRWGDDLLILSTCSYGYSNGRLLIVCRKLREGETPDEIVKLYQEAKFID